MKFLKTEHRMEFINLDRYIDSIIEKYALPAFDVSAKVGDRYYRRFVEGFSRVS